MTRTEKVIDGIVRILLYAAMVILAFMMLLTVVDVGGRYIFNRPLVGSTEITEVMMVSLSFLALLGCTAKKNHIKLELLSGYFTPKGKIVTDTAYYLLAFGLFCLIAWQNFLMAKQNLIENYTSWVLNIPNYPFYFVVSVACAMVAIVLLLFIFQNMSQIVKKWK